MKDADAQDLFGRAPATCLRLLPVSLLRTHYFVPYGRGQPHVEQWHQALAAGQDLAVVADLGQHGQRLLDGGRPVVLEGWWLHGGIISQARPGRGSRPHSGTAIVHQSLSVGQEEADMKAIEWRRGALLGLVLLVALAGAGCGGDNDEEAI